MRKIIFLVFLLIAAVLAGVFITFRFVPRPGKHMTDIARLLQQKYPPLIGAKYPEDATPTDKQKQWAMATTAIRTEMNARSHDILGEQTDAEKGGKSILSEWWGVNSRHDLLDTLDSLECGGHRRAYDEWLTHLEQLPPEERGKARRFAALQGGTISNRMAIVAATRKKLTRTGLAGWDFARYIAVCRWGVHAGYLTEEEAWSRIMPVARLLQKTFTSWQELAENYELGRRFWSLRQTQKDGEQLNKDVQNLLLGQFSPWARLKWETDLLPEKQKDDGSAEFRQGRACFFGHGNWDYDKQACYAEAFKYFSKSAEKGNLDAMYWLGLCHRGGLGTPTNMDESFAWFRKAADLGDGPSQRELAECYHWGWGTEKNSQKVFELMSQAATNGGGARAEYVLGWHYEKGRGTTQSWQQAAEWYQKAADHGEPAAQSNLGECYSNGNGVERNQFKAAQWFKKSALGGNRDGMCFWARYLEDGCGTSKNKAEALTWWRKAAEAGDEGAKKHVAELE